tara:strand:+ start:906 stop:1139 length:234 start_codon:yes stop_codon:yes gene_type:complete
MKKTQTKFDTLRARVNVVRSNFEGHPNFKWLTVFRKEHPQHRPDRIKNVYYLNCTNETITADLEMFWAKYEPLKSSK